MESNASDMSKELVAEVPTWRSFVCAVEADKTAAAGRALKVVPGLLDGAKTPRERGQFRCLTRADLDVYAKEHKSKSAADALAALVAADREEGLAKKARAIKRRLHKAEKEAAALAAAAAAGGGGGAESDDDECAAAAAAAAGGGRRRPVDAAGSPRESPEPLRTAQLAARVDAAAHEPDRIYVLVGPGFPKDAAEAAACHLDAVVQLASAPLPAADDAAADQENIPEDPNVRAGRPEPELDDVVSRGRPATRVVLPLSLSPPPVFAPAPPQPIEADEGEEGGVIPMVVTVVDSVADYEAGRAARKAAAAAAAAEDEVRAAIADCTRDAEADDAVREAAAAADEAAAAAERAAAAADAEKSDARAATKAREAAAEQGRKKSQKAAAGGRAFRGGDVPPSGGLGAALRAAQAKERPPRAPSHVVVTDVVLVMPDAPPHKPKPGEAPAGTAGGSEAMNAKAALLAAGAAERARDNMVGAVRRAVSDAAVDKSMFAAYASQLELVAVGGGGGGGKQGENNNNNNNNNPKKLAAEAAAQMAAAREARAAPGGAWAAGAGGGAGGGAGSAAPSLFAAYGAAARRLSDTAPEQGTTESEVLLLLVEAVVASHAGEAAAAAAAAATGDGPEEPGRQQLSSCGAAWGAEGDGGDVEGPWVIDAADEASLLQAAAVTQWGERLQVRLLARSLLTIAFSFFYLLTRSLTHSLTHSPLLYLFPTHSCSSSSSSTCCIAALQAASFYRAARARAARTARLWARTQVPGARGRHWPAMPQRPSLSASERGTRRTELLSFEGRAAPMAPPATTATTGTATAPLGESAAAWGEATTAADTLGLATAAATMTVVPRPDGSAARTLAVQSLGLMLDAAGLRAGAAPAAEDPSERGSWVAQFHARAHWEELSGATLRQALMGPRGASLPGSQLFATYDAASARSLARP